MIVDCEICKNYDATLGICKAYDEEVNILMEYSLTEDCMYYDGGECE